MKLRTVRIVGNSFLFGGFFILCLMILLDNFNFIGIALTLLGVFSSLIGYILYGLFWKCPFCYKHLPYYGSLGMEFCPYCGTDLEL